MLNFAVQKDMETNKSEFLGTLPERWLYDVAKINDNFQLKVMS